MRFAKSRIKNILLKSNFRCFYCGCPLNNQFEVDHVEPFSKSRNGSIQNFVAACRKCNRMKSNLSIPDFKIKLEKKLHAPVIFFFEKYGIQLHREGASYTNTLNETLFQHK